MNLATAQKYAAEIVNWLAPYCVRIEIAGSVRRGVAHCNDIDVVCIPKIELKRDLLGAVIHEDNFLWQFLADHVKAGKAKFKTGGNQPGKFCILQLRKCQLDVYFAEEANFASRWLCRTGSKEHNIWLAQRAQAYGMKWEPYEGFSREGLIIPTDSEAQIYFMLGLDAFIEPKHREAKWIKENCG